MPAPGTEGPEAMRNDVGGVSKTRTPPPGWTCRNDNLNPGNHKGSHSHTLSPLPALEPLPLMPLPGPTEPVADLGTVRTVLVPPPSPPAPRKAVPVVQEEELEASPVSLVRCGSVEDWLESNTPALLDAGAKLALSGKDPMFRSMFFGKLLDYQREVKSATLKAKGHVLGKVVETNPERKALMDAADEVANMGAGELMEFLRSGDEEC